MAHKAEDESQKVGYVVGGSLKTGLQVRLTVPPQDIQEGGFVVIKDEKKDRSNTWHYYGLITDLQLGSTDPRFADEQSETRLPSGLANLLHGQTLYTNLEVLSALMLEVGPSLEGKDKVEESRQLKRFEEWQTEKMENARLMPIKTVPSHHAPVHLAQAGDVAEIFGTPDEKNFIVGYTREQGHPVCVDLEKFIQRSSGIFGATGTGKSFLTRIILSGLIHYNKSSVLVFDMHNEYGFDDTASDTNERVVGLRTKFPTRVRVVGLGRGASIRDRAPDFNLEIAESDIQPQDIELLTRELNLKETTPTTLEALVKTFGLKNWFHEFKQMKIGTVIEDENGKKIPAPDSVAYWANEAGVHPAAAEGLRSKLGRVVDLPYVVEETVTDSVLEIIHSLSKGQHVILSFAEHESDLDYLLVTNLLTRRIRAEWEKRTNQYRSHGEQEPRPLVIVVEEAHKLLNREMAAQTTFSTIARELRKYYVTMLIIDQRPSQIYDEVMSQLGTRISGWLGDEADIHAVLSGLAGRDALRGMLSHLQPKEEVLLLGWGVPMPIPVRSRRYDQQFWEELLSNTEKNKRSNAQIMDDLGY